MKSLYLFLLGSVLLGSILLSACETIVEIDIPREAPRLVANAFINPDSLISVRVSRSKFVLDNAPLKPIENATAQIFENGQLRESLEHTGQGLYVSSFKPQTGSEYTLQVAAQGFESIEATSFIRQKVPIQQLAYDTTLIFSGTSCDPDSCYTFYTRNYTFDLTLNDDASKEDFYAVEVYTTSSFIASVYDSLTGSSAPGDTLTFQRTVYLYSADPALADPGFAGSDEGGTYGQTLLFTDEIFSGKSYTFGFETSDYINEDNQEVIIVLKTLEEAQYRYLRSRELQYQNDGNPFAEPSPVYSNIQNGYGIFAGYSADQRVIQVK